MQISPLLLFWLLSFWLIWLVISKAIRQSFLLLRYCLKKEVPLHSWGLLLGTGGATCRPPAPGDTGALLPVPHGRCPGCSSGAFPALPWLLPSPFTCAPTHLSWHPALLLAPCHGHISSQYAASVCPRLWLAKGFPFPACNCLV